MDARREIGKWLNEQPSREIDRQALAELCAEYDMMRQGDTCARACEGTAYRTELQRLRAAVRTVMPANWESYPDWVLLAEGHNMVANDQDSFEHRLAKRAGAGGFSPVPLESRVRRLATMENDMSKEETPQYFYKVDGCQAQTSYDAGCTCWHDEGTGPFPDERPDDPDTLKEWRFKTRI